MCVYDILYTRFKLIDLTYIFTILSLSISLVVVSHEEESPAFGGRVAQLRRTFATSSPIAKPPVPTKPSHLQLVPRSSLR